MWSKINTRRLAPQMAIAWNLGFGEPFRKAYDTSINRTMQYFDGKSTDYFVDAKEYGNFNHRLGELIQNEQFLKTGYGITKQFFEADLSWSEQNFNNNLKILQNSQLAKLFRVFALEKQPQFYARMWMVYRISNPLALAVEKELLKLTSDTKKAAKLLTIFSSPLEMNNVMQERVDALKLATQKKALPKHAYAKLLQKHAEKYAYTPMYGFDHEPFAISHFRREIERIVHPQIELDRIQKEYANRRVNFKQTISALKPSPKLRLLLQFYSDMIYLRDYRDMIREKLNFAARKLYLEIAKRAKLTLEQVNLLTNKEIIVFLEKDTLPSKAELLKREKNWLIIQKGNAVSIHSGVKAKQIAEKEIGKHSGKEINILAGTIGSRGFARGKGRIIHTNKDLHRVKAGEIMITSMTRQDFAPYLRKCVALVTDEGGITSHAAILCRELAIPCIVGTEIATQTFKDGDKLEVDAVKGSVRRID